MTNQCCICRRRPATTYELRCAVCADHEEIAALKRRVAELEATLRQAIEIHRACYSGLCLKYEYKNCLCEKWHTTLEPKL